MTPDDDQPEVAGIPFNRLVAFAGPYISIAAGVLASWLLVHIHFLGLFHVQHDGLSTAIVQLVVFALTTGVTWAGHQKWLTGHHIQIAALAAAVEHVTTEETSAAADFATPVVDFSGVPGGKPQSAIKPDAPSVRPDIRA